MNTPSSRIYHWEAWGYFSRVGPSLNMAEHINYCSIGGTIVNVHYSVLEKK